MDAKVSLVFKKADGRNNTENFNDLVATEASDMTTVKAFMTNVAKLKNGTPTKYSLYKGETADYVA